MNLDSNSRIDAVEDVLHQDSGTGSIRPIISVRSVPKITALPSDDRV